MCVGGGGGGRRGGGGETRQASKRHKNRLLSVRFLIGTSLFHQLRELIGLFAFCVNIRRTVNVYGHIKAKLSHQTANKRHIHCSNQTSITIKNDSDIKLKESRRRKIEKQKSLVLARV